MRTDGDFLDLRRRRTIVSFLAGIAVETLYTLVLAGIGGLVVLAFLLFTR